MDKVTRIEQFRRRSLERVETAVVDSEKNHIKAYKGSGRQALMLALVLDESERNQVFNELTQDMVMTLASRGIASEVYARQGEPGNPLDESACYVRVLARDAHMVEVERQPLDGARDYIIHATTALV